MFSFESQNSKIYLNYMLRTDEAIDNLSLGMMSNNHINGLLPISFTQIDDKRLFKFDVTSKVAAAQLFSSTVSKKWVIGLLLGITEAMLEADEYMINTNCFVMDMSYIFMDVSCGKAEVVCVPVNGGSEIDFKAFLKNVIFGTQFDPSENNGYVAEIISYLNRSAAFSPYDFKKLLLKIGTLKSADSVQSVGAVQASPQSVPKAVPVTSAVGVPNNRVENNGKVGSISQASGSRTSYKPASVPAQIPDSNGNPNEKKMSMFYLLCHYNKENAAKYKAQKQAAGAVGSAQSHQNNNAGQFNARDGGNYSPQGNFAIPGQPVQNDFSANNYSPNAYPQDEQSARKPKNRSARQSDANYAQTDAGVNDIPQRDYARPAETPADDNRSMQEIEIVSPNFGGTDVLGEAYNGKTQVLSDFLGAARVDDNSALVKQAYIIRVRNNEKIAVNKSVFKIGHEKGYVDYFIGDNPYVGRSHANIVAHDGRYFIIDNNSRNHTYLNGEIINSSEEVEIKSGDTFKLANESFEFKLF